MKRNGLRWLAGVTAALTMLPATSLAAELTPLTEAAEALLFNTENVSVRLDADFSWDGTLFKHMNVTQQQAGYASRRQVTMTTYAGEESKESGYTVYGDGAQTYEASRLYPGQYLSSTRSARKSLVRSDVLRRAAAASMAALGDMVADRVTVQPDNGGTLWQAILRPGDVPEAVNSTLSAMIALQLARENVISDAEALRLQVIYEDADATLMDWVKDNAPDELDAVTRFLNESSEDMDGDADIYWRLRERFEQGYLTKGDATGQVTYVRRDGSSEVYGDYNAYLRGTGQVEVTFTDYFSASAVYAQAQEGTTVTPAEMVRRLNGMRSEEYAAYLTQVKDYYRGLALGEDAEAVAVRVAGDGSMTVLRDATTLTKRTVWESIKRGFASLTVDQADLTARMDGEGRLVSVKGTVTAIITDVRGDTHPFTVTVDAEAGSFGETEVVRE